MTRNWATRMLLIALLFGNAIAAGVCAMICPADRGRPSHAPQPAMATSCYGHCEKKPGLTPRQIPSKTCCAWMAKNLDSPDASLKAATTVDLSAVAILAEKPTIPKPEPIGVPRLQIVTESRAPPWLTLPNARPRAPPTARK